MLTRRQFGLAAALQPRKRANVVFILCDRWRRPSAHKGVALPNLARLGREGIEFSRGCAANPASAPSRASVQTGRYPHAVSMAWNGSRLSLDYPCLAEGFVDAGYKTGFIGKWQLEGDDPSGFVPPGPRRRGYQFWAAFNGQSVDTGSQYFRDSPEPVRFTGGAFDQQTDLALDFIKTNQASPFLLTLSLAGQPSLERRAEALPESTPIRENVPAKFAAEARVAMDAYNRRCAATDGNLGRLLTTLETLRLAEDTILVFTAAHGDMLLSHGLRDAETWYEESTGVPLLLRWPGTLAGGTKQDWLFNNVDLAPTLRGLCGLPPLDGAQGEDRSTLIRNQGSGQRPESVYVQGELGSDREWRMVVRGWDKLVVDRGLKVTHLFNLAQDNLELDNLAGDRGTIRRQEELLALMRRWIIKTGDRVPFPGRSPAEEKRK